MSHNAIIHPLADVQSPHVRAGTRIWQYVVVLSEARWSTRVPLSGS